MAVVGAMLQEKRYMDGLDDSSFGIGIHTLNNVDQLPNIAGPAIVFQQI